MKPTPSAKLHQFDPELDENREGSVKGRPLTQVGLRAFIGIYRTDLTHNWISKESARNQPISQIYQLVLSCGKQFCRSNFYHCFFFEIHLRNFQLIKVLTGKSDLNPFYLPAKIQPSYFTGQIKGALVIALIGAVTGCKCRFEAISLQQV